MAISINGFKSFYQEIEQFAKGDLIDYSELKLKEFAAGFFSSLIDQDENNPNDMLKTPSSMVHCIQSLSLAQLKVMAHIRHLEVAFEKNQIEIDAYQMQYAKAERALHVSDCSNCSGPKEKEKENPVEGEVPAEENQESPVDEHAALHSQLKESIRGFNEAKKLARVNQTKMIALVILIQDLSSQSSLFQSIMKVK